MPIYPAHLPRVHVAAHNTRLQPIAFVFDAETASAANASLDFPDMLQLAVGKVVRLGVMKQLIPGTRDEL